MGSRSLCNPVNFHSRHIFGFQSELRAALKTVFDIEFNRRFVRTSIRLFIFFIVNYPTGKLPTIFFLACMSKAFPKPLPWKFFDTIMANHLACSL